MEKASSNCLVQTLMNADTSSNIIRGSLNCIKVQKRLVEQQVSLNSAHPRSTKCCQKKGPTWLIYFLQSGSSSLISKSLKPCTSRRFSTCSVVKPFEQSARSRCTMSATVDTAASDALMVGTILPSNASEDICEPPVFWVGFLRRGFWRVFLLLVCGKKSA